MPPHPQLTEAQTTQMAAYILSLAAEEERAVAAGARRVHAARGHGAIQLADGRRGAASRAVHRQGRERAPRRGGRQHRRAARADASSSRRGELGEGVTKMQVPQMPVPMTMPNKSGSFSRFRQLDLSGISDDRVRRERAGAVRRGGRQDRGASRLGDGDRSSARRSRCSRRRCRTRRRSRRARALKPTTGLHDVYFVFKNDQAKAQQMLFIVLTATFVNGASTPASAPATTPASTGGR